MLESKIGGRKALARIDRRILKRAYQSGRARPTGGLRIFLLAVFAVAAVMLVSQAVLDVGGDAGDRIAGSIFGRTA